MGAFRPTAHSMNPMSSATSASTGSFAAAAEGGTRVGKRSASERGGSSSLLSVSIVVELVSRIEAAAAAGPFLLMSATTWATSLGRVRACLFWEGRGGGGGGGGGEYSRVEVTIRVVE